MPRPGFVLEVDRSTPPVLVWHGEGFRLERLPAERSRVVYAPEPLAPLADPDAAIRQALVAPAGRQRPAARAACTPACASPSPSTTFPCRCRPCARPDNRQRVIEAVLDMAADRRRRRRRPDSGVGPAPAHDRCRTTPRRWATGSSTPSLPTALSSSTTPRTRPNLVMVGKTEKGEDVEVNRRVAESDLLVYVNINLVAMDGGHKSTSTGLMSYRSVRHHHNVRTLQHSRSLMDRPNSELHSSAWRIGRLLGQHVKVFQIETTLNNDAFPSQMAFLQKREWEWDVRDRATFLAASRGLECCQPAGKKDDLPVDPGAPADDERAGGRGGGRPRLHDRPPPPPAAGRRGRPERRCAYSGFPTSGLTTSTR